MAGADIARELQQQVIAAVEARQSLVIEGTGSKGFIGHPVEPSLDAHTINTLGHHGVIDYAPEELMLRVRAGTPLQQVQALLAEHGQQLAFEPPAFAAAGTVAGTMTGTMTGTMGGVVAAGLAGPGRAYYGGVRDFVLGAGLITGVGKHLEFGGQVMKNVAGYDVSRLLVGSFGTLGLILDISFKVLPAPEVTQTRVFEESIAAAQARFIKVSRTPLPVTASAWFDGVTCLRLAGAAAGVKQASHQLGGEQGDNAVWAQLRDQTLPALQQARRLWRVSVAPGSDELLSQTGVLEWHGGQRWLCDPAVNPRDQLAQGHATLLRTDAADATARFHPLEHVVRQLHDRLATTFDPYGLMNPQRMYRRR